MFSGDHFEYKDIEAGVGCPDNEWSISGGFCYLWVNTQMSFDGNKEGNKAVQMLKSCCIILDSQAACEEKGASLASIHNDGEDAIARCE